MDAEAISHQARAAIDSLTEQLRSLETQQTALLTSLHLTSSTLAALPNYTQIAPTLSQIPHYESKLTRLKFAMAQQQRDVAELKRRALDASARRRRNLDKIEERRMGERERDRTVLRARMVGGNDGAVESGSGSGSNTFLPPPPMAEDVVGGNDEGEKSESASVTSAYPSSASLATSKEPSPVMKTVKRKKKARQAEIQ
ncbi:hypothetical protein RUND412_005198 [Rhizina undulata]